MQQRSTFVTVVGWIFIVFSGLGVLESLVFMFLPFDKFIPKTPPQPGVPAPDPAMMAAVMHGMGIFMFLVISWVLLSSIGLVMRKNWARISFIVILSIGIFFGLIYVLIGALGAVFMPTTPLPGQPPEMAGMMRGVMTVMAVFGALFAGLYGWIIYMLCREKIRQEFESQPANTSS